MKRFFVLLGCLKYSLYTYNLKEKHRETHQFNHSSFWVNWKKGVMSPLW